MALLCWRSLIVSGFLGVAHHFLLVYLLPLWVFPDGADLWRVLLHGAVVIMQMVAFTPFIILVISMLRNAEQLEAQLHESAIKAREADNAKSSFLANMSHELRTPLNAIIGFTEAMKLELFGPLGNARYKTYSADVHGAGRHLLAVISELLDLAKISAGKMEVYAEEIDVAVFCRELLAMSATLAAANRNTMSLQLDDVPTRFGTDPTKLRQILLNLISNACKYTSDGTIELRAARDQAHPGGLVFTVVDTGIGIAEGDRSRIFEMFSQVNGAVTRPQGGTGLGLAVTDKLVHLLGGDLSCQSELGKGSAFKVRLRGLAVGDPAREMAGHQLVA
jgi:signal transduction histidine kinase